MQVALRMATTLANFSHKNVQADDMLGILEVQRPNVDGLQGAPNEPNVAQSKQTVKEICDYLGL